MALYCSNCGEETLNADARFCFNCGSALSIEIKNDKATLAAPEAETIDDTMILSMSDRATIGDDETTRAMPEAETMDDEESGHPVPGATDDDESTKPRPEAAIMDDEVPRAMPEMKDFDETTVPVPEDESTRDVEAAQAGFATEMVDEPIPFSDIEFKPGYMLENRYRLDEILGRGGFGAVYLAEDIKLKRRCVVKQMLIRGRSRRDIEIYRANFRREADLLAQLNDPGHPNIPEIFDYFSAETGNYLVMKYIEGQNLKDALEQSEDKMPWREAVRYAVDVCSALDYMHTKGPEPILHRDIKPANILLGDDGRIWLVDFGLAKADPIERAGRDQGATRAFGSLGYTPLEQWFGRAVPASDIYALGTTLHYLVTGDSPLKAYDGKFGFKIIKDLHGQLPPIRKSDSRLPKELEKIISQAVAAEPQNRPTPLQLQQQLEALISAQAAALFTFKNGQSAQTVPELVDLCEGNRQEAEIYLYNGDFERWYLLINRNDLAEAARQAVKTGKNRHHGLERFLKLILPNLFYRRMRKATRHLAYVTALVALITLAVILFVVIGISFGARWFLQRAVGGAEWDVYALDLNENNHYTETFLTTTFNDAGYFDEIEVDVSPPDGFNVTGRWRNFPLDVVLSSSLRLGNKQPRVHLTEVNGIPLFLIGENVSAGINFGIDRVIKKGPVDVSSLIVKDEEIIFRIEKSSDPARPAYNPPAAPAAPTPVPTPTPIPLGKTMVVVFNEANHDITLKIEGEASWDIAANRFEVIEIPAGEYEYFVHLTGDTEILANGTKIWNPDKAYRLRIGSEADLSKQPSLENP